MLADLALAGVCLYAGIVVVAKYGGIRALWSRAKSALARAKESA